MRPHTRTQCRHDRARCAQCHGHNAASTTSTSAPRDGPFVMPSTAATMSKKFKSASASSSSWSISDLAPSSAASITSSGAASSLNLDSSLSSSQAQVNPTRRPVLVELPAEVLVKILSHLTFKEISQIRMVSRRFNEICASMLNSTFQKLQNHMLQRFHEIKSKMPRRESARRNHPLGGECDVVETIHMRLTLLQMTFGKHIERKHVCFFPGEILDEVQKILLYIKHTPNPAKSITFNLTDELFDLSTMAMEHFKDQIEPTLPEITYFGAEFLDFATPFSSPSKRRSTSGNASVDSPCSSRASVASASSCSESPWSIGHNSAHSLISDESEEAIEDSNRKRIKKIRAGMKKYNDQLVEIKREQKANKAKMESQTKQIQEYSQRLDDYEKKFEDSSRKFQSLLTELNKCRTELQFWRSKSGLLLTPGSEMPPADLVCSNCEAPVSVKQSSSQEQVHFYDDKPPSSPLMASEGDMDNNMDDMATADDNKVGPSSPRPVTRGSCSSGPPSPSAAVPTRKRRGNPDLEETTRKSLRGVAAKGRGVSSASTGNKRPKMTTTH